MTDNEIMTALRRCADRACYRCTEYGKEYCRETVAALAWDLMYNQKAELDNCRALIDLKAVKASDESDISDKATPKHPSYNCRRGMLCPACDKALWVSVEIKSIFGKKEIKVKEQPNFCKYCGQALLPAYSGV